MEPSNPFYEPSEPANRRRPIVHFNPSGSSQGQTPVRPPSSHLPTPTTRQSPRTDTNKLDAVLDAIENAGWTLPKFLEKLLQPVKRTQRHQRVMNSMLSGQSKPYLGTILSLLEQNARDVSFLGSDTSIPPGTNMFAPNTPLAQIRHATPAMTTWAIQLAGETVHQEGQAMTQRPAGLHSRAQTSNTRRVDEQITWDTISTLSLKRLEENTETHAPATSFVLKAYSLKDFNSRNPSNSMPSNNSVIATRLNAMMALTFARSNRASLYPLCRGIWLFAAKASRTIFRVESRIGQSVAYSTVYIALRAMGRQKLDDLRKAIKAGRHFITVSDNIQTYAKQRVRRIGRENRMITGLSATAIEMQDYDPEAFNLEELVERQCKQERKTLTAEMLLADIDSDRLHHVATVEFLEVLFGFVPRLSTLYRKDLDDFISKNLAKKPIPGNRRTKIIPLATNSADEMHIQGLKEGVLDFATTQMGINEETLNNTASIWAGDGKTFNMFLLMKKLLSPEESNFSSFRWLQPLLELWHTKWTDLSRVVRTHWGTKDDPSSLAKIAEIVKCPPPTDLRKVDFYDGAHLVGITLDAHILSCWELCLSIEDLTMFFKREENMLSFETLVSHAQKLGRQYATTQAYNCACNPPAGSNEYPDMPPAGSSTLGTTEDVNMADILPGLRLGLPMPERSPLADTTLANTILFMRNAIWWREVCKAIAHGDSGRVWEILKVFDSTTKHQWYN
ncbi:hypothetical protein BJ912DRAFT_970316 [Pholiota molesta]|nr:hypothetical protein BJ912DRAFT_970316 [Pholiota molesta]